MKAETVVVGDKTVGSTVGVGRWYEAYGFSDGSSVSSDCGVSGGDGRNGEMCDTMSHRVSEETETAVGDGDGCGRKSDNAS